MLNPMPAPALPKTARLTGILLLALVVVAPFGMIYVPTTLIAPGDAATTTKQIVAAEGLFRLGMASDAVVFLLEIGLTVLLYGLLKPVNQTLSLIAAAARLAMTIVQGINLLPLFLVLRLVSGEGYLTGFAPNQLQILVLLFLNAHEATVHIWGLFFSLHLFVLGYLVYKARYIPSFVGFFLLVAALCYLVQNFGAILLPQYAALYTTIGYFSAVEIVLPLWLVIKGVKE
ncbi:MAG: DUF4386 domain-containing protein [Caldilineaceae bacterium]